MSHDISQPVPQGGNGAQDAENSRIAAIANELERLCAIHEAQLRDSQADVSHFEVEQRAAEQMAKAGGYWIPMMDIFDLGVPGPSGNENDTYVADNIIYKVNNLLNSGSIAALLKKILLHNLLSLTLPIPSMVLLALTVARFSQSSPSRALLMPILPPRL